MGFSSFITQDTDEEIWNDYTEHPTKVKILTPEGEYMSGVTNNGYLRFNGIDYFEIVAKMNGYEFDEENPNKLSSIGNELFSRDDDVIKYPKIVSMSFKGKYEDLSRKPEFCAGGRQGYWDE